MSELEDRDVVVEPQHGSLAGATWPWPLVVPPNNRTNTTAQLDAHPNDHNLISDALNTLQQMGDATRRGRVRMVPIQTFGTGWSVYGDNTFAPVAVGRQAGIVTVTGLIAAAATHGDPAFTLPVGYRPTTQLMVFENANVAAANRVDFRTDGGVMPGATSGTAVGFVSVYATFAARDAYGIEWGYDVLSTPYVSGGSTYVDVGNGVVWGNNTRKIGLGGAAGWGAGVWTTNNTYALLCVNINPAGGPGSYGRVTFFQGNFASENAAMAAVTDAARVNIVPAWLLYRDASGVYSVNKDVREWL